MKDEAITFHVSRFTCAMPVSEETFQQVVQETGGRQWELICRRMQPKPVMTRIHARVVIGLTVELRAQLALNEFDVRLASAYLRSGAEHYFIPDVTVITLDGDEPPGSRFAAEFRDAPVPLVIELWSEAVDGHDLDTKIWQYQARGDEEIWQVHPYDRTLTAWRRQPDGSYTEPLHYTGTIQPVALPGVTITIDTLFD